MLTRSKSILAQNIYIVDIDFDSASKAWKANKKSVGNGVYVYICENVSMKGKKCNKACINNLSFCETHSK